MSRTVSVGWLNRIARALGVEAAARESATQAEKAGAKTLLVKCDVSEQEDVRAMLDFVEAVVSGPEEEP